MNILNKSEDEHQELRENPIHNYDKACEWIHKLFTKSATKRPINSYKLKHIIERYLQKHGQGAYLGNDTCIIAFKDLGFKLDKCVKSPNCVIYCKYTPDHYELTHTEYVKYEDEHDNYTCTMCKRTLMTVKSMKGHLKTKGHQRRVEQTLKYDEMLTPIIHDILNGVWK